MALNKTAFSKRADQLKRFEESETNRQSILPKNISDRKVRFSSGCIFLASCVAGEKDEVLNMLNCGGADIDTANIDGLTALHQACIEDNLDMVEFLVTHRADINRKDNEGWTPLHATSSCGILSIARYLVENGADLASVNSDGELPIDIAGTNAMAELLQQCIDEQEIDCDEARQQEEKMMMTDAKKWLRSDASEADRAHPKTGATALHVAAAKGYTKVLGLLLAGRADVDRQDNDGWTPLHAATYWGKKEAAQMLIASMADMDIQNYSGQTAIDIAPKDMVAWLEDLKKTSKRTKRRPVSQIRISDNLDNNIESPPKVIRVEVKPEKDANKISGKFERKSRKYLKLIDVHESEESESEDNSSSNESEEEIDETQPIRNAVARDQMQLSLNKDTDSSEKDAWRRNATKSNTQNESPPKIQVPDKENQTNDSEVILRRTQSFENDEKFYQKYIELRARIKANSCSALPATQISGVVGTCEEGVGTVKPSTNFIIQRSASLKDQRSQLLSIIELIARRYSQPTDSLSTIISNSQAIAKAKKNSTSDPISPPSPTLSVEKVEDKNGSHNGSNGSVNTQSSVSSALTKLSPTNIFKNFFKSFVPPTRDEESETQRKAHAKRVRETRRSTQGVTLDEIKSAEQLVKMKNANNNNNNGNDLIANPPSPSAVFEEKFDQLPPSPIHTIFGERRPSWRLKCDYSSKFKLEDSSATNPPTSPTHSATANGIQEKTTSISAVAPRRQNSTDNENDKENDSRGIQSAIQRRRRPKRRSTGVVHVDMEDIDNEYRGQESPVDNGDDKEISGSESRSRINSVTSSALNVDTNDDGEFVDYKALYEAAKAENDKLKGTLKGKEQDLVAAKSALERLTAAATKSSLSENEKREKRAMERKISEMEEELKLLQKLKQENERLRAENRALTRVQMDALKTENQRLKDENGALIRVISKLSK
ncbi:unnamed protein product [Diamesa hyperborea]